MVPDSPFLTAAPKSSMNGACISRGIVLQPFKYEAQIALFKDPVRTAQTALFKDPVRTAQ